MGISLKILSILVAVCFSGLFIRTFGFQILNGMMVTASAPPSDLNRRVIAYVLVMSFVSLLVLKDWIKK